MKNYLLGAFSVASVATAVTTAAAAGGRDSLVLLGVSLAFQAAVIGTSFSAGRKDYASGSVNSLNQYLSGIGATVTALASTGIAAVGGHFSSAIPITVACALSLATLACGYSAGNNSPARNPTPS